MSTQQVSENVIELRHSEGDAELRAGSPPADDPPREIRRRRPSRRILLVSGGALAIALAGAFWITAPASSETTNDAYVSADATAVAPKVKGLIGAILVADNQSVRAGDPLLRIDPEEFDSKVEAARADLADSIANVAAARAALASLGEEEKLAAANVETAQTAIRSSDAEAARADADRRRMDELATSGFSSRRTVDAFQAEAVNAEQGAARARAMLLVSRREAGVTAAKWATLAAALSKAEAQKQRSAALLDLARQDQMHTLIRAPIDGVVGDRQVRVGDYVQAGSRLLTLVPVQAVYVTANFKETQIRKMRVGQEVRAKIDAIGAPLTGRVESLAPGSGSTFSLLPFEPGTGNFTKIVQRVPVRIRFDPGQAGVSQLRPGLSATVTVRVAD